MKNAKLLAEDIVDSIIEDLYCKNGFKEWWDAIEEDQKMLRGDMIAIVIGKYNDHDK